MLVLFTKIDGIYENVNLLSNKKMLLISLLYVKMLTDFPMI